MKKGFTLVELSIFLVLIGLIVAAVVSGNALIKQAQLRNIITELNKFTQAINTFKLAYNAIPGDMLKAYDYWGTNCASTAARCNGNGDGAVFWGNQGGGQVVDNEALRFTQHLTLAGLVDGNYAPASGGCVPGASSVKLYRDAAIEIGSSSTPPPKFNGFAIAARDWTWAVDACYGSFLTPGEMLSLDSKMDDGHASSGILQAWTGYLNGSLSTNGCLNGNEYNIAFDTIECAASIIQW